ncbi:MAG: VWA domain-containing protein [Akkermansiaceae bacterium]|nr:VWA domain-containing protein [Akkermansiaceae bacterium]
MSFVQPNWLLLLIILPMILLGAILAQRASNKAWQQLVADRLRKQLVKEGSTTRRWTALVVGLIGCGLLIIVLARPYDGETSVTEQTRSRNILIAIDTSRSMLVQDVAPDRMRQAKATALELIQTFPNDRIGVIAFSGAAVSMAPLTIDHTAVHETISQLDTKVIPSGGSDLAAAVDLALQTLEKSNKQAKRQGGRQAGSQSNALIIISDGEDHSEKIKFAGSEIRDAEISVCTIGVGSSEGGVIPDLRTLDGKFRDTRGNTVYSQLNSAALEQLASAGAGSYVAASAGADVTISRALASLDRNEQEGSVVSIPNETYQWFLCPAIALLILSVLIKSNLLSGKISTKVINSTTVINSAVVILLLTGTQHLQAASVMDQALGAYQKHDYLEAIELFGEALADADQDQQHIIEFSQGSSAYRLSRWDAASRYFSRALLSVDQKLQEQSHYNLGNTLFQWGWTTLDPPKADGSTNAFLGAMRQLYSDQTKPASQQGQKDQAPQLTASDLKKIKTNWQDAISHYQASLKLNPDNTKAEDNQREVEKNLAQLKEAEQQAKQEAEQKKQEQQEQGEGDQEDEQDQQEGEGEQGDKDSDQNGEQDGENQESNEEGDPSDQEAQNGEQSENEGDDENGEPGEQQAEQNPEESKEEFAARILREQSDAEVRPVRRRLLRLRRPEKDW